MLQRGFEVAALSLVQLTEEKQAFWRFSCRVGVQVESTAIWLWQTAMQERVRTAATQ